MKYATAHASQPEVSIAMNSSSPTKVAGSPPPSSSRQSPPATTKPNKSSKSKGKKSNAPAMTTSKALLVSEYCDQPSSSSPTPSILATASALPPTKPAILPIVPNSSLLSRLDAFLPQLEQANSSLFAAIAKEPGDAGKRKFDIETLTPGQDKVIEMKLGLGLFEARNPAHAASDSHSPTQHLLLSNPPATFPPAISFVTPSGGDGPRIYAAGDMDVDSCSSLSSEDQDEEADSDMAGQGEEAITAESLEEMVMRFYNEPLGGGEESGHACSDQESEAEEGDDADQEGGGSAGRKLLVEEMMDGVESTSPSPQR